MAYSEFYMQTTGNDLNAGSTNADAALVTDVGGTYAQGTGAGGTDRYTASAGTPFSATVVGEYVSVYTAGATSTTFVGQVTAVNGGGSSLDISLTIIYGTRPANASTKTAKTGGAWASLAITGTLFNTGTVPQSTRVNVKYNASPYANTTNTRTITIAGTTLLPFWVRGYNTTPGDIESDNTMTKPQWTWTTGGFAIASAALHHLYSGLDISGARTAGPLVSNSGGARFRRCRKVNTGANAAGNAYSAAGISNSLHQCYLSAHALANVITTSVTTSVLGCSIRGGLQAVNATSALLVRNTVIDSPSAHGILHAAAGTLLFVDGLSVYNLAATFDGIQFTGVPTQQSAITNCNFELVAGRYDINNNSGANTNFVYRAGNRSRSSGITAHENNFGDSPSFDDTTDTVTSWTNAAGHDFSIVAGSTALGAGVPKKFENESYTSYVNAGAVQSPAVPVTAGGGCRGVGT